MSTQNQTSTLRTERLANGLTRVTHSRSGLVALFKNDGTPHNGNARLPIFRGAFK